MCGKLASPGTGALLRLFVSHRAANAAWLWCVGLQLRPVAVLQGCQRAVALMAGFAGQRARCGSGVRDCSSEQHPGMRKPGTGGRICMAVAHVAAGATTAIGCPALPTCRAVLVALL